MIEIGQYFKPVVINEDGEIVHWMISHDYDSFTKLMEHSYLGNDFVQAFETLLVQEAPVRVVWAGDYADGEIGPDGEPLTYVWHRSDGEPVTSSVTLHHLVSESEGEPYRPAVEGLGQELVYNWYTKKGTRRKKPLVTTITDPNVKPNAFPKVTVTTESHPYLINWDKKLFVDKRLIEADSYGMRVHPLPLLTAEGNGRGGGDFDGEDPEGLVGSWSRDHLSVSDHVADEGFTEIKFDLKN